MKKLILIVALFFLLITYGNYRKHKVLSRLQNIDSQPTPKPKRARALSYEEMAALNRAKEAESLFKSTLNDSTKSDSVTVPIIPSVVDSSSHSVINSRDEAIFIEPDTTLTDTLKTETAPDSL